MKLKFEADMPHQTKAIRSVVDLFRGQTKNRGDLSTSFSSLFTFPNTVDLQSDQLAANLAEVQQRNGLPVDEALITGPFAFPNFTVEMETGTGKTYIYLRTALELFENYGWRKFLIIVPSIAIRAGVLSAFKATREHFAALYGNTPYNLHVYDGKPETVRTFAMSNDLEFLVMTMQAFNVKDKDKRIIYDYRDGSPEKLIDLIRSTNPILIMDEPQKQGGEATTIRLPDFNPALALRYSATHKDYFNLVYRLTPYEAYRQGLVKQIEVASVTVAEGTGSTLLVLEGFDKKKLEAKVKVNKLFKVGDIREDSVTVKLASDLQTLTHLPQYEGYIVSEINVGEGYVEFTNGVRLEQASALGNYQEEIFRAQIKSTIEEHFIKQAKLKDKGIKVLSLFFIDKVANFTNEDGIIKRLFKESFDELKQRDPAWAQYTPEKVWASYFAEQSKGKYKDTKGNSEDDAKAYDLIMNRKEILLTFEEPRCFIFSHSALREGWDNPNVFQICTLNTAKSDMRKRQEIGRGVRLAVNQKGDRIRDEHVNRLTVFANESYEQYVSTLQNEIAEDGGDSSAVRDYVKNRRERITITRKEFSPEFMALWDRIKHRTRYSVSINSEVLIDKVIADLKSDPPTSPHILVQKAEVKTKDDSSFQAAPAGVGKIVGMLKPIDSCGDLVANLASHLRYCNNPSLYLSRGTLLAIIKRCLDSFNPLLNPSQFVLKAASSIRIHLLEELVNGVQYEKIEEYYEQEQLEKAFETWKDLVLPVEKSIYDHIQYDSTTIEKRFAEDLDRYPVVRFFLKLPKWFTVKTPVGSYNPDWAIALKDEELPETDCNRLYFVAETKGSTDQEQLRGAEQKKLKCAEKHYKEYEGVEFKVVTKVSELLKR